MTHRTCEHPGCNKPHRARGLCATHYNQVHAPNRHKKKPVECSFCGETVMKDGGERRGRRPTCSNECRSWLTRPYCRLPHDHWALWYGRTCKLPVPRVRRDEVVPCAWCGECFHATRAASRASAAFSAATGRLRFGGMGAAGAALVSSAGAS